MSSGIQQLSEQLNQKNDQTELNALQKSLKSMKIQQNIARAPTSDHLNKKSNPSKKLKRTVRISCNSNSIPFTVHGGSAESRLISVKSVNNPDLLGVLAVGDIILSINGRAVSGMLLCDVRRLLNELLAIKNYFDIELVDNGEL
ncbi:unnamed protein product [Thelazia callipaeda]|uniref:PDZ domain-containing protein n=1 Tax=Thelazia callipaeda TaxID=103827 RepID=A0A0N5D2K6_THECL|nr:unnamed protein product [Thelazia callipaeda]